MDMLKNIGLSLLFFCGLALAQQDRSTVVTSVCYGYSCAEEGLVVLSGMQLDQLKAVFESGQDADSERKALAEAVGLFYRMAAQQTPVGADRGGNFFDQEVYGRMDCIDHSTSTNRLLNILVTQGLLRHHRVLEPVRRSRFFSQHFSAVIEEIQPAPLPPEPGEGIDGAEINDFRPIQPGERFVVDSWFVDNGEPAVILPLVDWLKGAGPDVR